LDGGNNKKAVQEADRLLKKQKDFPCAKARLTIDLPCDITVRPISKSANLLTCNVALLRFTPAFCWMSSLYELFQANRSRVKPAS